MVPCSKTLLFIDGFRDMPHARPSVASISEEEWAAVLKLSSVWDFFDIHKLAIEELSVNPITKILLVRQYTARALLFAGYDELTNDTESISVADAERLGWDTAIRIFNTRQKKWHPDM
jgi:hypothetical protein